MVESAASFNTRGDLEGPRWAEERLDAAKRIWIASEMLAVGLTTVVGIMAVDPAALQWEHENPLVHRQGWRGEDQPGGCHWNGHILVGTELMGRYGR